MRLQDINIIGINEVAGISVTYTSMQEYELSYCLLKRKRGNISIVESKATLKDIELLKSLLPKNIPVALNISGKVVLNKEIVDEGEGAGPDHLMFGPGLEDFYHFEVESPSTTGKSYCRKNIVDSLLDEFSAHNINVIRLSIGPYPACNYWEYGLASADSIPLCNGELKKTNTEGSFQFVPTNNVEKGALVLAGQTLPPPLTIPYIDALQIILKLSPGIFPDEKPNNIIENYLFRHYINKTKFLVLGVVFIALMLNYFAFESFRKQASILSAELEMNSGTIAKRDSLESILKAKENFIDYIGKNRTFYSFYLDEIAATIPAKIVLDKLDINPLSKKMQKKEPLTFVKKIRISGSANTSLTLNQWVNKMEELIWIDEVIVLDYYRDEDNSKGIFLIDLKLKK